MKRTDTTVSVGTQKKVKRLAKCLVSILTFWRVCTRKKKKAPGAPA